MDRTPGYIRSWDLRKQVPASIRYRKSIGKRAPVAPATRVKARHGRILIFGRLKFRKNRQHTDNKPKRLHDTNNNERVGTNGMKEQTDVSGEKSFYQPPVEGVRNALQVDERQPEYGIENIEKSNESKDTGLHQHSRKLGVHECKPGYAMTQDGVMRPPPQSLAPTYKPGR